MKKFVLTLLVVAFSAMCANAQFIGAFYEGDPDAWFDKEPFFACQNNYVYYGYGQDLQNITVVINGEKHYSNSFIWRYGTYLYLGEDNGFEFSSGDKVALYWGNQCIGTWTYRTSSALNGTHIKVKIPKEYLKTAWKYIKHLF